MKTVKIACFAASALCLIVVAVVALVYYWPQSLPRQSGAHYIPQIRGSVRAVTLSGKELQVPLDEHDPLGTIYLAWDTMLQISPECGVVYFPIGRYELGPTHGLAPRGARDNNCWVEIVH